MNIKPALFADRVCGMAGVKILIANITGIRWKKGAMKRMNKQEAAIKLKAHAETLKKSRQLPSGESVMELSAIDVIRRGLC